MSRLATTARAAPAWPAAAWWDSPTASPPSRALEIERPPDGGAGSPRRSRSRAERAGTRGTVLASTNSAADPARRERDEDEREKPAYALDHVHDVRQRRRAEHAADTLHLALVGQPRLLEQRHRAPARPKLNGHRDDGKDEQPDRVDQRQ